jgi:hypothetical protein
MRRAASKGRIGAGEAAAAMGRTANALTLRDGSMILRRDQAPEREYPGPAQRLGGSRQEPIY